MALSRGGRDRGGSWVVVVFGLAWSRSPFEGGRASLRARGIVVRDQLSSSCACRSPCIVAALPGSRWCGCFEVLARWGIPLHRRCAPGIEVVWMFRGLGALGNPPASSLRSSAVPLQRGTEGRGVSGAHSIESRKAPFGCLSLFWRRGRDLNPRGGSTPPTRLAGERLRPLGHLSGCRKPIRGLIEPPTPGDLTSYPVRTRRSMSCRCPWEYTIYIGC